MKDHSTHSPLYDLMALFEFLERTMYYSPYTQAFWRRYKRSVSSGLELRARLPTPWTDDQILVMADCVRNGDSQRVAAAKLGITRTPRFVDLYGAGQRAWENGEIYYENDDMDRYELLAEDIGLLPTDTVDCGYSLARSLQGYVVDAVNRGVSTPQEILDDIPPEFRPYVEPYLP